METVPWRRQQTEETFSAENSHRDTPAAPSRQTNKQRAAEERIISTPHRSERMFIGGVRVRRDRRNTEGFTLLTLQRPINANHAADSGRPIIAYLRMSTSAGGSERILAQIKTRRQSRFVSAVEQLVRRMRVLQCHVWPPGDRTALQGRLLAVISIIWLSLKKKEEEEKFGWLTVGR